MDNHDSEISVEAIELYRANRIVLFTIPLGMSHKLQPLNRLIFGHIKTYLNRAHWMSNNPEKNTTIYEILGRAYLKACF